MIGSRAGQCPARPAGGTRHGGTAQRFLERWGPWLLAGTTGCAAAAQPLSNHEAGVWLQRMADAARNLTYQGVFTFQHGDQVQTLKVNNQSDGVNRESRLSSLDGTPREIHCSRGGSVSFTADGKRIHSEKRFSSRYFPDLLPLNAANLVNWYAVRLGDSGRVAGLDCQQVELTPKDTYRWGYVLCVDPGNFLPLKAEMINDTRQPLFSYAFAEVKYGKPVRRLPSGKLPELPLEAPQPSTGEVIQVRQVPPGFVRVATMKRNLKEKPNVVEHWVYSDGLTHISLFIEPSSGPVGTVKGASARGMLNMLTRQVGPWQVTVLGDAPWPAVETVATNLAERAK